MYLNACNSSKKFRIIGRLLNSELLERTINMGRDFTCVTNAATMRFKDKLHVDFLYDLFIPFVPSSQQ